MGTVLGWCSVPPWVASALAYPVGNVNSFSDQTEKLAREAGYRVSFSFHGGTNMAGMTRSYDIKRVGVGDQSWSGFKVQAAICSVTGSYRSEEHTSELQSLRHL